MYMQDEFEHAVLPGVGEGNAGPRVSLVFKRALVPSRVKEKFFFTRKEWPGRSEPNGGAEGRAAAVLKVANSARARRLDTCQPQHVHVSTPGGR